MLKFQAIFHSCLQIKEANITECYIHCYLQTLTLLILIFLAYLIFSEFEHPSMFLLLLAKPYEPYSY